MRPSVMGAILFDAAAPCAPRARQPATGGGALAEQARGRGRVETAGRRAVVVVRAFVPAPGARAPVDEPRREAREREDRPQVRPVRADAVEPEAAVVLE